MEKRSLIEILKKVLKTDADLNFLRRLKEEEIQTLVACIRDRVDQVNGKG